MKKSTMILFGIILCILFSSLTVWTGTVSLPRTGQTKCYETAGAEITCAGTGQDGEIQVAAAWQQFGFFNCKLHEIVGK